jgi:hypothetical protein
VDRDDLGDDAHARQDHDVDGRVAVEPEEVLVQHRVAAEGFGSKMPMPSARSKMSSSSVMPMTGVARTWMMEVA